MPREPDTVESILLSIRTAVPELAPERLREIAMSIRQEMGGRRYYVSRKERGDARR